MEQKRKEAELAPVTQAELEKAKAAPAVAESNSAAAQ